MRLTLYSKPDCHLCHEMQAIIERLKGRYPLTLEVVDISTDPVLQARYRIDIPVLQVNGREIARHRVTELALERALTTAQGQE